MLAQTKQMTQSKTPHASHLLMTDEAAVVVGQSAHSLVVALVPCEGTEMM